MTLTTEPSLIDPETLPSGVARSVRLFSLFRKEQADPDTFYATLAADTVRALQPHVQLRGACAVDIGGGPGYVADALSAAGARCVVVEYAASELTLHDRIPAVAVLGDGQRLPLADGAADVVHSSNVLEHVPDPWAMLEEMVRVLRPGTGIGYLTFTNWLSPWGGHETSPWHYLGGEWAALRYEQRTGAPPKNRYGESLHRLGVAEVLRWFRTRPDVEVLHAAPRYLPEGVKWLVSVPAAREVFTWNLAVTFRRI